MMDDDPSARGQPHRAHGLRLGLAGLLVVLGGVAGLAEAMGWTGHPLTAASVGLVVLGVLLGLWDQVLAPYQERRARVRARRDRLRSVLEIEPAPVKDVDPYRIGVFRSDLAERAAGTPEPPVRAT